jgi:UDP-N-acetylglucosamine acyltransferase
MTNIHKTALVDAAAQLADDVEIGPYTVVGPNVQIGSGTKIGAHCVISGYTEIGSNNQIFQFNSIGAAPQDKKYRGEPTRLVIGNNNTIREFCTFNTGTAQDVGVTSVGDDNWIMAYVHIAHDCQVGSHTILANNATLGGHVHLGDWVIVGGLSGIHQFVKVGAHAMLGFASAVTQDVAPFVMADGNPLGLRGLNAEGLKRRGFTPERVANIKEAYRTIFRRGLILTVALEQLELMRQKNQADALTLHEQDVQTLIEFISQSTRGIAR